MQLLTMMDGGLPPPPVDGCLPPHAARMHAYALAAKALARRWSNDESSIVACLPYSFALVTLGILYFITFACSFLCLF
jgi:hypothetical protein